MSETPEEQFAALHAAQVERARKAIAAWNALSPEEQQRRVEAMEQRIKRAAEIKSRLGLGRRPSAPR